AGRPGGAAMRRETTPHARGGARGVAWREPTARVSRGTERRAMRVLGAVGAVVALLMAASPGTAQVMDDEIHTFVLVDRFEYAPGGDARPLEWEALSWTGGDYNR